MASLSDAFTVDNTAATLNEKAENPQSYEEYSMYVQHKKEARHILGLVGGNEVSRIAGNQADLESDLLGITRPNSDSTARHHLPPKGTLIERSNPKIAIKIDTTPVHLNTYQQWAYPSVIGPVPMEQEVCHRPEKY